MIQPITTYCSTLYFILSSTQLDKFAKVNERAMQIISNDSTLQLPKIITETGVRSFMFQGAQIFNKLPKDFRGEYSFIRSKRKV